MSVLSIRTYPDPVLQQISKRVEVFDETLQILISDMRDTLDDIGGLGLAAPQVGCSVRVFIYLMPDSEEPAIAIVNPVIVSSEGKVVDEEGCLSMPDYRANVRRNKSIIVEAQSSSGEKLEIKADGLLARIFQHEMDHLEGLLILNRISSLKRGMYIRKIQKQLKESGRS